MPLQEFTVMARSKMRACAYAAADAGAPEPLPGEDKLRALTDAAPHIAGAAETRSAVPILTAENIFCGLAGAR